MYSVADDSRISKMSVINPQKGLVHPQTQNEKKKTLPEWIVHPQPQLLRIRLFGT
jgi:hypothetical protein